MNFPLKSWMRGLFRYIDRKKKNLKIAQETGVAVRSVPRWAGVRQAGGRLGAGQGSAGRRAGSGSERPRRLPQRVCGQVRGTFPLWLPYWGQFIKSPQRRRPLQRSAGAAAGSGVGGGAPGFGGPAPASRGTPSQLASPAGASWHLTVRRSREMTEKPDRRRRLLYPTRFACIVERLTLSQATQATPQASRRLVLAVCRRWTRAACKANEDIRQN